MITSTKIKGKVTAVRMITEMISMKRVRLEILLKMIKKTARRMTKNPNALTAH